MAVTVDCRPGVVVLGCDGLAVTVDWCHFARP